MSLQIKLTGSETTKCTRGIELLQTIALASKCKSIRIARNIGHCRSKTIETKTLIFLPDSSLGKFLPSIYTFLSSQANWLSFEKQ